MKIEYSTCDVCGKKIDTTQVGMPQAKVLILKCRTITPKTKMPVAPFKTVKLADITPTEVSEKVEIDLCEACSNIIEDYCLALRNKNEKQQESKKNK